MAKIVTIVTSLDEKGCTFKIVQRIMDGAMGTSLNTFELVMTNKFRYITGCDQCNSCSDSGICKINDDISPLLLAIKKCDSLIVATPLIFGDMTAQLKAILDRCTSFLDEDGNSVLEIGKKVVIVVSCSKDQRENAEHVVKLLEDAMVDRFGFQLAGVLLYDDECEPLTDQVLEEAREIGKRIRD